MILNRMVGPVVGERTLPPLIILFIVAITVNPDEFTEAD
jgi:hypothetical protein